MSLAKVRDAISGVMVLGKAGASVDLESQIRQREFDLIVRVDGIEVIKEGEESKVTGPLLEAPKPWIILKISD